MMSSVLSVEVTGAGAALAEDVVARASRGDAERRVAAEPRVERRRKARREERAEE
jgi:hypothetical protein